MEDYLAIIGVIIILLFAIFMYIYQGHKNGNTFSFLERIPGTKEYKERKQREKEELEKVRIGLTGTEAQLHHYLDNKYLSHSLYELIIPQIKKIDGLYGKYVKQLAGEFPLFYGLLDNESFPEDHNTKFLTDEKMRLNQEFGNLTPSQQEAVFSDEDAIIVNAGAGTGKTKTIENKIKYLYKEKKVPLKDILVVTYSKKSQEDMMGRICKTLDSEGIQYDKDELKETISTFHAFGKRILDEYESRYHKNDNLIGEGLATRRVLEDDEKAKIINQTLGSIKDDPVISSKIIHYFLYYDKQIMNSDEEEEGKKKKYKGNEYPSFLKSEGTNVVVKSYGELLIANYLVEHGMNVEYEGQNFHYTDKKGNQKDYKPDFYLPDYKIFIEYFGVDESEKTAPRIDEEDYVEGMHSKIEEHKKSGNILIDMRYADIKQGREFFLKKFEEELNKNGVNTNNHVSVDTSIVKEEMTNLGRVLSSFLALYSECRLSDDIIYHRINNLDVREKERAIRFYEIFKAYYQTYKTLLNKNNSMDFCDMILGAINCLHAGYIKRNFRYILVDEFQDISKARADLLIELTRNHNRTKLFCVGDDWQSIYKFTGSELGIFLNFDHYFGYTKHITLFDTFRFNQGISNISGEFIQKNPTQIKKTLYSKNQEKDDKIIVYEKERNDDNQQYKNAIKDMLNDRIDHFSESDKEKYKQKDYEITCLYLTRYSLRKYHNDIFNMLNQLDKKPEEDENGFKYYDMPYSGYKFKFKIKAMTVHSSKGLEADYVIVDHVNGKRSYTFPSTIDDDPVLNLCMVDDSFAYPFAEERRLFYVAITRGKNKAYIIHDKWNASSFIRDLNSILSGGELNKNIKGPHCVKCGGELMLLNSMTGEYECQNGCEGKYFEYNGYIYKAPKCNCGCAYSVLRRNRKTGAPFRGCSTYPKCWKFHKFKDDKYCIGYIKNSSVNITRNQQTIKNKQNDGSNYMQKQKAKYSMAYEKRTDEDDTKLIQLYKEGKSVRELMKIFNRNEGGIRARLKKLGLINIQ